MSHFAVLVVTDQEPTDETLEAALLPFHEFECTGIEAYIQEIDRTDEAREEYASGERDEDFTSFVQGWYCYATLGPNEQPDIEGAHRFGYIRVDEVGGAIKVVKRTNPNAKWDWYVVGGRYTGRLVNAQGVACDYCRVGELNHTAMAAIRRDARIARWDAREKDLKRGMPANTVAYLYDISHDAEHDAFIETDPGFTMFGMLKAGQWYERGDMGWFGMVSNEDDGWHSKFGDLMASLHPDQWVTVVDCHI